MITYDAIVKANDGLQTLPVKGKDYVMVKDRIMAFRRLIPDGTITTNVMTLDADHCVIQCSIYDGETLLARATAMEEHGSSPVNRTSYVENCETSAVGRALGFLGLGISDSIASAEEMVSAVSKQYIDERAQKALRQKCANDGVDEEKLLKLYKVKDFGDVTESMMSNMITFWDKIIDKCT